MTRAELIHKIARDYGVPDYEAKYFFETFLQKISVILKPGQAIKIRDYGLFQQRHTVIMSTSFTAKKDLQCDVITFTPEEGSKSPLVFNIPSNPVEKINMIDAYFSLSIGKPVIPLEGIKASEAFLKPAGVELKRLIESKAEKLLIESEIISRKEQESDILVIKNISENQPEITLNKDRTNIIEQAPAETGRASEFEHVAWDFGEDLSKQIEEESILDVGSETSPLSSTENTEREEELGWDFSQPETDTGNIEPEEQIHEDVEGALLSEDEEEKVERTFQDELKQEESRNDFGTGQVEFERVKSLTSELEPEENTSGLTKSELNLSWDFDRRSLTKELSQVLSPEPEKENEDSPVENKTDTIEKNQTGENEEVLIEGQVVNSGSTRSSFSADKTSESKLKEYSLTKSRSPFVFFIAMVTILTVGAVVVVYLTGNNFTKLTNQLFGTKGKTVRQIKPDIVERNFQTPVTYPYPKKSLQTGAGNEFDPKIFTSNNNASSNQAINQNSNLSSLLSNGSTQKAKQAEKKEQAPQTSSMPPAVSSASQKVQGNIYLRNGAYIVQVSSWRSKPIAELQASKYNKKGFKAFVEPASVPGRGVWYRVKVGNFNSLKEAEGFVNKDISK